MFQSIFVLEFWTLYISDLTIADIYEACQIDLTYLPGHSKASYPVYNFILKFCFCHFLSICENNRWKIHL